jgi:hypothetical protein
MASGTSGGKLLFGLVPKSFQPSITPGIAPVIGNGLGSSGYQNVIPVTASEIKIIAELPQDILKSVANLFNDPKALQQAAISVLEQGLDRTSASFRRADAVVTGINKFVKSPTINTVTQLAMDYGKNKLGNVTSDLKYVLGKLGFADVADDIGDALSLVNIIQQAFQIAAMASAIIEAERFVGEFASPLSEPGGKQFLLNIYSSVKDAVVLGTPPTSQASATGALPTPVQTGLGAGLEPSLGQVVASPPSLAIAPQANVQSYIYWYTD